ncbi:hypothetical protein [Aneurinibacillus migulanus]|uniref:hypothetical protein n=1 Tax=Aneurinibacillus migulanus TaxID=47500 RepID=UPI0020A1C8FB|nr:hypothetical protein [Aneurinibacillus migulanus]MCP1357513.1 hypothetical protein [Aneurinibacillus migulanus]
MLALAQANNRFTFPLTPEEIQIQSGNEVETFTVITGEERTGKPVSKAKRVSFTAIFPRFWQEIWETGTETIKYQSPEQALKLLEQWKLKPVVVIFDTLFSQTMWMENMEPSYKNGQANLYINFTFIECKPIKIVSYSNTKQLLKPGLIITKPAVSRANTTNKESSKKQNKDGKGGTSKDTAQQRQRIETKNRSVKGGGK